MIQRHTSYLFLLFSLVISFYSIVHAHNPTGFIHIKDISQLFANEGFAAGTLVKTPEGYVPIEALSSGSLICAYDIKNDAQTTRRVLHINKVRISEGIQISCNGHIIITGMKQKFFVPTLSCWVTVQKMSESNELQKEFLSTNIQIKKISESIEVYQLLVDADHTFYVTDHDVLVHNAIPLLYMGTGLVTTSAFTAIATPIIAVAVPVAVGWIIWTVLAEQIQKNKNKQSPSGSMGGGGGGPGGPGGPWRPNGSGGSGGPGKQNNEDQNKKKKKKKDKKKRDKKKKEDLKKKKKENEKGRKRKTNKVTKQEFFKRVRNDYEYYRDGVYKRRPGAKGLGKKVEFLKWDHLHNDVEAYNAAERHLGSMDPATLELYKGVVLSRKLF